MPFERQLSHGERDAVRAAYNYAQHLPERREMMQAWADFLDQLKMQKNETKPVAMPIRRWTRPGINESPSGKRLPAVAANEEKSS